MKMVPAIVALSLAVVLTPVEAKRYSFTVDAINNPKVTIREGTSFKIISTDRKIDKDAAQFEAVSSYIKTILSSMGYFEAPAKSSADLIIDISYGTEQPHIEFELRQAPPPSPRTAAIHDPSRRRHRTYTTPRGITIGPKGQYREILPNEDKIIPKTVYSKFLKITASLNQPPDSTKTRVEAWSVTTVNQDESPDLEKYLPLLAAASISYIGQKTNSREKVILRDKSESVHFVKRGM